MFSHDSAMVFGLKSFTNVTEPTRGDERMGGGAKSLILENYKLRKIFENTFPKSAYNVGDNARKLFGCVSQRFLCPAIVMFVKVVEANSVRTDEDGGSKLPIHKLCLGFPN